MFILAFFAAIVKRADRPGRPPASTCFPTRFQFLTADFFRPLRASLTLPAQQQRLHERDVLKEKAHRLKDDGKLVEAIGLARQILAIEQEVLGAASQDADDTLTWTADAR